MDILFAVVCSCGLWFEFLVGCNSPRFEREEGFLHEDGEVKKAVGVYF
jgi:hypothetical protein